MRGSRRSLVLLLAAAVTAVVAACSESVSTQVVPVAQPLPAAHEQMNYRLIDAKGRDIGSAVLSITPENDNLRLGVAYDFGNNQTDTGSVLVQPQSMKPVQSERTVVDGAHRYVTHAEYTADSVTVTFDDGQRTRTQKAALSEAAYDNLESIFLWRTLDLSVGTQVRYVNVVVDPRHGSISRAVGTVEVMGREDVQTNAGPVQAWRVQFRSAGITNTAWYRADAPHPLVRYEIAHGPTLVADSAPD